MIKAKIIFLVFVLGLLGPLLLWVKSSNWEKYFGTIQRGVKIPSRFNISQLKSVSSSAGLKTEEKISSEEAKRRAYEQYVAAYGPCRFIPILMYHHVGPVKNWLYVDPGVFASQMDYLKGKGYTTVSLPEAVSDLNSGNFPAKPIVLTFDDGYADVFANAYHILADRGMKATFFIITQLKGGDYMSWEQLREIAGNSLFTIGDHTMTHPALAALSEERIKEEILTSQSILQRELHVPINVFAFPYGSQTQRDIKYLQEGNFVAAVNSEYGVSCAKNPFGLRRIRIGNAPLSRYGL